MSFLTVKHSTVYRYKESVGLGEHRMMFRPRESHDLRVIKTELVITPKPVELRWIHDAFDNSVAVAAFDVTTTELRFESTVQLEHFQSAEPDYQLENYARTYPFRYADDDFFNLGNGLRRRYVGVNVDQWALQFLDPADRTGVMHLLRGMTRGIRSEFKYSRRLEKGVQDPETTLAKRSGTCRDFAVLMIDAARSLGVAARFVSGYIYTPSTSGLDGGGATHAWMQAYLPGAGWIDFDPTNSIVGNRNLIRVAVAWLPEHVLPLWGTYDGPAGAFVGMDVDVAVTESEEAP